MSPFERQTAEVKGRNKRLGLIPGECQLNCVVCLCLFIPTEDLKLQL